jgi:H2-forming N5,N10-methylenetetrahydromethanopterin dehydrogenase-like enzyme
MGVALLHLSVVQGANKHRTESYSNTVREKAQFVTQQYIRSVYQLASFAGKLIYTVQRSHNG